MPPPPRRRCRRVPGTAAPGRHRGACVASWRRPLSRTTPPCRRACALKPPLLPSPVPALGASAARLVCHSNRRPWPTPPELAKTRVIIESLYYRFNFLVSLRTPDCIAFSYHSVMAIVRHSLIGEGYGHAVTGFARGVVPDTARIGRKGRRGCSDHHPHRVGSGYATFRDATQVGNSARNRADGPDHRSGGFLASAATNSKTRRLNSPGGE